MAIKFPGRILPTVGVIKSFQITIKAQPASRLRRDSTFCRDRKSAEEKRKAISFAFSLYKRQSVYQPELVINGNQNEYSASACLLYYKKKKGQKEEHSFDPYTLNTDKKRLKYACYLTGFNINPTIGGSGRRTRHQTDGSGYRYDKIGTLTGEDVLNGQSPALEGSFNDNTSNLCLLNKSFGVHFFQPTSIQRQAKKEPMGSLIRK